MKKTLSIVVIILIVCAIIGGCVWSYFYFTDDSRINPSRDNSGDDVVISNEALWSREDYPKVDASLATQPLTDAFMANFTATPVEEIVTDYTNTHPAYVRLIDGEVDLIVVTQPSAEELALAKEKGVELEVIPVVNEAFVFLANVFKLPSVNNSIANAISFASGSFCFNNSSLKSCNVGGVP